MNDVLRLDDQHREGSGFRRVCLKCGYPVDASGDIGRFRLLWDANLKLAVLDDGIFSTKLLELFLALHFDFKGGFATGNGDAVKVQYRDRFWLPSATTGGLAEDAGSPEWICIEFTVGAFHIIRERKSGYSQRRAVHLARGRAIG